MTTLSVAGDPRKIGRAARVLLAAVVALVALTSWYLSTWAAQPQSPFDVTVDPVFVVDGSGSNVDSIAFWEAPNPANSLMFVTSKGASLVEVWKYPFDAASGQPDLVHGCIDNGTNGVVVDQEADRLYVSVRSSTNTCVFSLPELTWLRTINSDSAYHGEPNLGLLHLESGQRRLYVTDDDVVYIHDAESGDQIGKFYPPKEVETIVGDDFNRLLYIPDENGRSGIFTYDPGGNPAAALFGGGVFDSDEEGIIIYTCPPTGHSDNGEGFIVVSDQISAGTEFEFFDRKSKEYLGKLRISGVSNTDGVGSTQQSSAAFPLGVFAAIDSDLSAAGLGWHTILEATGLACPTPTGKAVLTIYVIGSGMVGAEPPGGVYDVGRVVTLTAVAAQYWEFSSWSGELIGSTNPITLTMTADKVVTATFRVNAEELPRAGFLPGIIKRP